MEHLEIIELITRKDRKGLEVLYVSYGSYFYGYAIKKWQFDEDEAWEVVYKTLDTLVLKLKDYSFNSKAHFESFIFKVFLNFLRQSFRLKRQHQTDIVYLDLTESNPGRDEVGAIEEMEVVFDDNLFSDYYQSAGGENANLSALKAALKSLEEEEQDILLLRAQNYTYAEIGNLLKIEAGLLKVKHFRAKQKLVKLINNKIKKTI
jgi:RNA polymerase sigma-70 factor (ECF subfamily)